MKSLCTILLLALLRTALVNGEVSKHPEVRQIVRPYTPEFIDLGHITTADSASFTQPPARTILSGTTTIVEVMPRCHIDSMTIFVRHSYPKVDTLAHLHRPPWRTEWNYADLLDQDQIHLQFGYQIYQPGGKIISSPSLPHQWVIDRTAGRHNKKYQCRQINKPDTIIIDGTSDEWNHIRRAPVGTDGSFALCWTPATVLTPATLYFLAEISQRTVVPTDIVELHLDHYRTRTSFASDKHRSILFAPAGRSYTFVADSVDAGGFRQCDSIAAIVNEGMTWRATVTDSGYVVEAAIPFYALSELKYPPRRFGLDVSVRSGGKPFHFAGWANDREYSRYNPGEWGTAVLQQTSLPLNIILLIGALIIGAIAGAIVIITLRNSAISRTITRKEASGDSINLQCIRDAVVRHLDDPDISIAAVAVATGLPEDVIAATLSGESGSTFEHFVGFTRIEHAKQLLTDFTLQPEAVASRCGFSSVNEMDRQFQELLHTSVEAFRTRLHGLADDDDDTTPRRSRSDSLTPGNSTDASR